MLFLETKLQSIVFLRIALCTMSLSPTNFENISSLLPCCHHDLVGQIIIRFISITMTVIKCADDDDEHQGEGATIGMKSREEEEDVREYLQGIKLWNHL